MDVVCIWNSCVGVKITSVPDAWEIYAKDIIRTNAKTTRGLDW